MRDDAAERLTKANEIAAAYIKDEMPDIFAVNRNRLAYGLEKEYGNVGFTLYDENMVKQLIADEADFLPAPSINVPKDLWWNKKLITAEITSGILQGESIGKLADRFMNITDANRVSAIRNARTFCTAAENAGRQDGYKAADKLGIKGIRKQWLATLDNRTRHSHRELDGQTVAWNEKFESILGSHMMHPGDKEGAKPGDLYNCRCTMITVEKSGIVVDEEFATTTEDGRQISGMNYKEWEEWKKAQEQKAMYEKRAEAPTMQAKTKAEAETIAKQFGVDADYSKYDISVANAINKTMQEYVDIFGKHAFDNLDEISTFAKGEKLHEWGGYSSKNRSIKLRGVNSKNAIEKFGEKMRKYQNGFFSTDSNLHIIRHELGHAIHDVVEGNVVSELRKYERSVALKISKDVSFRAGVDDYEFVAECLAQYLNGQPSKIAIDVVEIIKNGFKYKFG